MIVIVVSFDAPPRMIGYPRLVLTTILGNCETVGVAHMRLDNGIFLKLRLLTATLCARVKAVKKD